MVSLFPALLSYQQLSPFIIRLVLGGILIYWGYKGLKEQKQSSNKKVIDVVEMLVGALLIIGSYTQAAAGLAAIGFIVCLVSKIREKAFLTDGVNYVLLLLVLSLSLLLTGPGWYSFDLPL